MSINEVRYLPECGSTNAYVKEHFEEFGPVGAVYTENQTAGRGRLGRSWPSLPPCRCWQALRFAASCSCATAWTARSSGPTTFC